MQVPVVHRLSVVGVASAALTVSANAWAVGATTDAEFPVGAGFADQGGAAIMMISKMDSDCYNYVWHSMRYSINWNLEPFNESIRWIDVGFSVGRHDDVACSYPIAFWGDLRDSGYSEHTVGPYLNYWSRYMVLVQANESAFCAWDAWLDDIDGVGWVFLGTSTSNCPGNEQALSAGIIATSTDAAEFVQGWQWGWERKDSSGTWQNGWQSPLNSGGDSPPFIRPYTPASCGQCEFEEVLNVPFSF